MTYRDMEASVTVLEALERTEAILHQQMALQARRREREAPSVARSGKSGTGFSRTVDYWAESCISRSASLMTSRPRPRSSVPSWLRACSIRLTAWRVRFR